jgi:hypothetical protein
MQIEDMGNKWTVDNLKELDRVLRTRHENGANAFWITHDDTKYPLLSLLVKDDLAFLQFFRKDRDAGFASVGRLPGMNAGEVTAFPTSKNRADDLLVQNDAIVPFSVAFAAVKDFFRSQDLPRGVEWQEL